MAFPTYHAKKEISDQWHSINEQENIINGQENKINALGNIVSDNRQIIKRHEKILKRTLGGSDSYKRTAAIGMVLSSVGGTVGSIAYSMKTTCWNTTGFSSIKCLGDYVLHSDTSNSDRGLNTIPWGLVIIGVCCLGYSTLGLIDSKSKREKQIESDAIHSKQELDEIKKQIIVDKARMAATRAETALASAKISETKAILAQTQISTLIASDNQKRELAKLEKDLIELKNQRICAIL